MRRLHIVGVERVAALADRPYLIKLIAHRMTRRQAVVYGLAAQCARQTHGLDPSPELPAPMAVALSRVAHASPSYSPPPIQPLYASPYTSPLYAALYKPIYDGLYMRPLAEAGAWGAVRAWLEGDRPAQERNKTRRGVLVASSMEVGYPAPARKGKGEPFAGLAP